jgi:oligosaccharide repeat unit polymerase
VPMMWAIAGAAVICLSIAKKLFTRHFNPISIWVMPWSGVLLLFHLRFINYEELSAETTWAIALGSCGYILGCVMTSVRYYRYLSAPQNQPMEPLSPSPRELTRFDVQVFHGLVVVGTVGALSLLIYVLEKFGWQYVLSGALRNASRFSREGDLPLPLALSVYLLLPTSLISGLKLALIRRFEIWDILILIAFLAYAITIQGRTILAFWFLLLLTGYLLGGGIVPLSRRIAFLLVGFCLGILVVFLVINDARGSIEWYTAVSREKGLFRDGLLENSPILGNIYQYLTSSITSLDDFIRHFDGNHSYGTSVGYPITYQLAKMDLVKLQFAQGNAMATAQSLGGTNVYTILRAFYTDFGLAGCFGFSVILGVAATTSFCRFLRSRSISSGIVFGYFCVTAIAAPYEYMLYSTMYTLPFVLVPLISIAGRHVMKPRIRLADRSRSPGIWRQRIEDGPHQT